MTHGFGNTQSSTLGSITLDGANPVTHRSRDGYRTEWRPRLGHLCCGRSPGGHADVCRKARVGAGAVPHRREAGRRGNGDRLESDAPSAREDRRLKLLPPQLLRKSSLVVRFEREMRAVGMLSHPHLVQAHDAGDFQGVHYLAMEFVDGVDLSRLVRRSGPVTPRDAVRYIRQAAQGLGAAHEAGLVHRDIKPGNLMLAKNGTVKVMDWVSHGCIPRNTIPTMRRSLVRSDSWNTRLHRSRAMGRHAQRRRSLRSICLGMHAPLPADGAPPRSRTKHPRSTR